MKPTLVDTSVWIEHLSSPVEKLIELLSHGLVYTHRSVIGELACGNLSKRNQFLHDLGRLPAAAEASTEECLNLIDTKRLFGKGLGWIDVQLLASTRLSNVDLFTFDKKLKSTYERLS